MLSRWNEHPYGLSFTFRSSGLVAQCIAGTNTGNRRHRIVDLSEQHANPSAVTRPSLHPSWTNAQVRNELHQSVIDLAAPGKDSFFGHGRIDACVAVGVCAPETQPLSVSIDALPKSGRSRSAPGGL